MTDGHLDMAGDEAVEACAWPAVWTICGGGSLTMSLPPVRGAQCKEVGQLGKLQIGIQ